MLSIVVGVRAALYHQPANALSACHADPNILDCFGACTVRLEPEHQERIERLLSPIGIGAGEVTVHIGHGLGHAAPGRRQRLAGRSRGSTTS